MTTSVNHSEINMIACNNMCRNMRLSQAFLIWFVIFVFLSEMFMTDSQHKEEASTKTGVQPPQRNQIIYVPNIPLRNGGFWSILILIPKGDNLHPRRFTAGD